MERTEIEEDAELTAFLKARLAEPAGPGAAAIESVVRFAADEAAVARSAGFGWRWGASLVAALLLVVCGASVVRLVSRGDDDCGERVAQAIRLLAVADDVGDEFVAMVPAGSADELLLAWQDVPYRAALDEDATSAD